MSLLDQAGIAKPMDDLGITAYGYVEGSWTYSASAPPNNVITGRVFDFENQDPTLNQLSLTLEKPADIKKAWDIGFRMNWIYGGDTRFIHSVGLFDNHLNDRNNSPDNQIDLSQAYIELAVPVGNGLLLRAGKFWSGFPEVEAVDPTVNALYSHSFLFAATPATFTGITGTYAVNDSVSVTLGVIRGWNDSLEDHNDAVSGLAIVTCVLDKSTSLYAKLATGPEQSGNSNYRTLLNLGMIHAFSDQFSVTAEGMYLFDAGGAPDGGDSQFYGLALYASYKFDAMFTLNGRVEAVRDEDGFLTGTSTSLYEATLGLSINPFPTFGAQVKLRPEIRFDYCPDTIFDSGTDDYQVTFAVDAIFAF